MREPPPAAGWDGKGGAQRGAQLEPGASIAQLHQDLGRWKIVTGKVENRNRAGAGVAPPAPSAAAGMENSWGGGGRRRGGVPALTAVPGGASGVPSQLCCW